MKKIILALMALSVVAFGVVSLTLAEQSSGTKEDSIESNNVTIQKDEAGRVLYTETSYPGFDAGIPYDNNSQPITTDFYVKQGTSFPFIDGNIGSAEWADAYSYNVTLNDGKVIKLYLKSYTLEGTGYYSIYPSNPSYQVPCGQYLLIGIDSLNSGVMNTLEIFFDEGDDGWRGSGSADGLLGNYQEDVKKISWGGFNTSNSSDAFGITQGAPEPASMPWDEDEVWKTAHNLGNYCGNYCYWSSNPSQTTPSLWNTQQEWLDGRHGNIGWGAFSIFYTPNEPMIKFFGLLNPTGTQVELFIPFHGGEFGIPGPDVSDLTFESGDTIGFRVGIEFDHPAYMILGTCSSIFPTASIWTPSQWARIHIENQPTIITITSPQEGQTITTPTPTITWDTSGISSTENLRLKITHILGGVGITQLESPYRKFLSMLTDVFGIEKAYAESQTLPIGTVVDLDVIVPNTGSYTVPAGELGPNTNYTLELSKQTAPEIKDIIHFNTPVWNP